MDNVAVQRAKDLAAPAREWLQGLFGRSLAEDEEVTVLVSAPHPAPAGAERRAALDRLETILNRAAVNMRDVSDVQFEAAVAEAMASVRPPKQ